MKNKTKCKIKKCRYWIDDSSSSSKCCINLIKENSSKITLEDIGKYFNVTRMRICQIEKIAIKKLKKNFFNFKNSI